MSPRVRLIATDPVRQHQLATVLAEAGHVVVADFPDVCVDITGSALPRVTIWRSDGRPA